MVAQVVHDTELIDGLLYFGFKRCFNRVSSTLPYFLSDCLFVEEDVLENKQNVDIVVVTIDPSQQKKM